MFLTYIKSKRARFGIKLYCLCPKDPNIQGYMWKIYVDVCEDRRYTIPEYPDSDALSVSVRELN